MEDLKTGPKEPHSTILTEAEEAMIVAFRRHTLLPLDDCLYALQPSIPRLTRSALHRCLQRHGISRLPDVEGDKPKRQRFKRYPIGFFHIDIAEVQTAEGKLYLFVGIDRTSKFAITQLVEKADRKTAWEFLEYLLKAVPYRIHTILTGFKWFSTTPFLTSKNPRPYSTAGNALKLPLIQLRRDLHFASGGMGGKGN